MPTEIPFKRAFRALMENEPFPWQCELYRRLSAGDWKRLTACDIPTGLGKTAVIPIWLIALANRGQDVPRRLVYVVNRRTVVDQATDEAERIRDKLTKHGGNGPVSEVDGVCSRLKSLCALDADPDSAPLAISTLRGQFADNGEWSADPARPAIIVGTVDLIGSALLFSSYRAGRSTRPLHAGFLGQDVLLVHDEAHLEPAFQKLIEAIRDAQKADGSDRVKPFRGMALTATPRRADEPLTLSEKDAEHPVVKKRLHAKKAIRLHPLADEKKETSDAIVSLATSHQDSGQAILIFVRTVADAKAVSGKLEARNEGHVALLVGPLRGHERDRLATKSRVFARFLPPPSHPADVEPAPGTVYLVCTSAGEVGVNISADHMVCDLTPFDSMTQRLGRVNRFGDGDARVDIVHPAQFADTPLDAARRRTLERVKELPTRGDDRHDGSPAALRGLPLQGRLDAASPKPLELETTDILFDAWALTSIRELPGRPAVEEYLHGVKEEESADTYFAWREEVGLLGGLQRLNETEAAGRLAEMAEYLDAYQLAPHELLRERTFNARLHLKEIAKRSGDLPAWVTDARDAWSVMSIKMLAELEVGDLIGKTIVLPPTAGGLRNGILDGKASYDLSTPYDVADMFPEERRPRRLRFTWGLQGERPTTEDGVSVGQEAWKRLGYWPSDQDDIPAPKDERTTRHLGNARLPDLSLSPRADEGAPRLVAFVRPDSADDETRSRFARGEQGLAGHLEAAETIAAAFSERLLPERWLREAVRLAAKYHDLGKHRKRWQNGIGNFAYPAKVLAKSGHARRIKGLEGYRHEFGSLLDARDALRDVSEDVRDLVLHSIATHHGRGRPHFDADEAFDPKPPQDDADPADLVGAEVPRRFARLQRRFGRWGLAYLESLLRAADYVASAAPSATVEDEP
jgi:CRISPR-associated endonuclease/helicase Cas3